MTNFLQAAASYYGLGEANTRKSEVFTDGDEMIYIVELKVSDEDMIAIARRMQEMQDAQEIIEPDPEPVFAEGPDAHALRQVYNALSKEERSKYGSFGRYAAAASIDQDMQAYQREVKHVDVPEEESTGLPDAVWLKASEASPEQKQFASDISDDGYYLVQWSMLTAYQQSRYVQPGEQHD